MPTTPAYRLLALDLDGTLIDHTGKVSDADRDAVRRARDAGITVTLCTGRALIESASIISLLDQTDPVIVSGGAMVACPRTGHTLERFTLTPGLIARVHLFLLQRRHPSIILKDPHAVGYDYLVVSPDGPDAIDPATRWWFKAMGVRARYVQHLDDDDHPEHSVRIGAYSANTPVADLADELRHHFGAETMLQHFSGVLLPQERRDKGIDAVHIVELFDPRACKWQALQRLAARLNIPEHLTAAIGDQTNDLSMITHAGLGIAMGNATPAVTAAADRHTLPVGQGVAHAIDRILAGEW